MVIYTSWTYLFGIEEIGLVLVNPGLPVSWTLTTEQLLAKVQCDPLLLRYNREYG